MELEQKITIAAIATLTSAIISSLISILVSRFNSKKNEERALDDLLIQINTLTIEYPYFEDSKFISNYRKHKTKNNEYLRYDSYCTIVFNFLERLCRLYNYDLNKVNKFVHYIELIESHGNWWLHETNYNENRKGYEKNFVILVDNILRIKMEG